MKKRFPFGIKNSSSGIENRIRIFAGQYYDAETGLHYNYHRYYDPDTGRYLTPDPIGLAGGINLFAYVQNNPVNLIDPYGLTGLEGTAGRLGTGVATGTGIGALGLIGAVGAGVAADLFVPASTSTDADWYPPYFEAKGERNWEKGRGDDPFWDKSPGELETIEKTSTDPKVRQRAKKIRKQKQKQRKKPCN